MDGAVTKISDFGASLYGFIRWLLDVRSGSALMFSAASEPPVKRGLLPSSLRLRCAIRRPSWCGDRRVLYPSMTYAKISRKAIYGTTRMPLRNFYLGRCLRPTTGTSRISPNELHSSLLWKTPWPRVLDDLPQLGPRLPPTRHTPQRQKVTEEVCTFPNNSPVRDVEFYHRQN